MIPKLIHQTFPRKHLPDRLADNVASIISTNPGYEHRLYDDDAIEQFIKSVYGSDLLRTYQRIDRSYGAARADLFRYLVMYELGGVYLDIKSNTRLPLDTILLEQDSLVLSHWHHRSGRELWGMHPGLEFSPKGELQQWHIIAAAKHPFLASVINETCRRLLSYRPWAQGVGWLAVLRTTGPIMYTQVAHLGLPAEGVRVADGENELGLEYSIFDSPEGHKLLFKRHYISNDRCLTSPSWPLNMLFWAYYRQARLRARGRRC